MTIRDSEYQNRRGTNDQRRSEILNIKIDVELTTKDHQRY